MKKLWFLMSLSGLLYSSPGWTQNAIDIEDARIADLLALKAEMVQKNELEDRYIIQLGSFNSITQAENALRKFEANYAIPVRLQYESPNYKVWAGNFTSRLSAERIFVRVKEDFKSAFVFRPR